MILYDLESNPGPISDATIESWKNQKVIVISKHSSSYVAGMLNQAVVPDAIIIANNMVRIGIGQPPKVYKQFDSYDEALEFAISYSAYT